MTAIGCSIGDITRQPDCQAIVNAANARLVAGGGVCGAIHHAAGPELEAAAVRLAPIAPGEAVATPGFRLPNRYVIHVLGPVYASDPDPPATLARGVTNALLLADRLGVERIAFPAISTGIFGYPLAEAARVMMQAARAAAGSLENVREIRFVVTREEARLAFEAA